MDRAILYASARFQFHFKNGDLLSDGRVANIHTGTSGTILSPHPNTTARRRHPPENFPPAAIEESSREILDKSLLSLGFLSAITTSTS